MTLNVGHGHQNQYGMEELLMPIQVQTLYQGKRQFI